MTSREPLPLSPRDLLVQTALRLHCDALFAQKQSELLLLTLSNVERSGRGLRIQHRQLQTEAELLQDQRRELARLHEEMEAYAYAIAHDLRQPLLAASMALRAAAHAPDPDPSVPVAQEGVDEALDRIEGLLVLARLSRREPELSVVDLSTLAHQLMERTADICSIPFTWQVQPELSAEADPVLLGIILENLIVNAVKHGARDDGVEVVLTGRPRDHHLVVCVTDNGPGIAHDHQAHLFDPFRTTRTPRGRRGTGLGLTIAHRAVQRMGGLIWYEEGPDGGARFCFQLREAPRS